MRACVCACACVATRSTPDPRKKITLAHTHTTQTRHIRTRTTHTHTHTQIHAGSDEGRRRSEIYDDAIHLHTIRLAMLAHLRCPPRGFEAVVSRHFALVAAPLQEQCAEWARCARSDEMRRDIAAAGGELTVELARLL